MPTAGWWEATVAPVYSQRLCLVSIRAVFSDSIRRVSKLVVKVVRLSSRSSQGGAIPAGPALPCSGRQGNQTPSDGTKHRILYVGSTVVENSPSSATYHTIASPTGFAVLTIASGGTAYHLSLIGTQY